MIPSDWIQIHYLSRNLLYLSLSRPHSEFTSGRCFHIQRGPCPSGSGVSTRVISALRSGCQGKKTGSASAPQKAQGTQMKAIWTPCVYVGAGCGHICVVMRACILCVFMCKHVHIGEGRLFQSACWQTVSWLMSSCRPSLFMSPVTHLPSQSTSTWNPETP